MSDFEKIKTNATEIEKVISDYENKLTQEKKQEFHIEEMKKNLKQIKTLENEKVLLLMEQITNFKNYLLEEIELTTEQEEELKNLEVLVESEQEQEKIRNEIKNSKSKTQERLEKQREKKRVRWAVPSLGISAVIWGISSWIRKRREKKAMQNSANGGNSQSSSNNPNNGQKPEEKKFRDTGFGKALKWIGIGAGTFLGVRYISNNWSNIFGSKESEDTKKERQIQATERASQVDDVEFDKIKDEYVFKKNNVIKRIDAGKISSLEDLKRRTEQMSIQIEKELQAEKFALQVEGIKLSADKTKYVYTVDTINKEIDISEINTLEELQERKKQMDVEISNEKAEKITLEDIREKLKDKNYRQKCEKIGNNVNSFFEMNRISHKKLGEDSDADKIGEGEFSSGVIVAHLDTVYQPIGIVFEKDVFEKIQSLGDNKSRYYFWKDLKNSAKIQTLQLLKSIIPDIPDRRTIVDMPLLGEKEVGVEIELDDKAQEKLNNYIYELQKKGEHFGMVKTIFEKQMQIMVYLNHVKENLKYKFAEKKLLEENPDIFQSVSAEKKEELISNKLDDENDGPQIIKEVENIFASKKLSELADLEDPIIQESLTNPVDTETQNALQNINQNEDDDLEKINKLENKESSKVEEWNSLGEDLLSEFERYEEYRWHDVLSRTMGTWFDTEDSHIREMAKQFYNEQSFAKQKEIAKKFLNTKTKPTAEDIENFKQATKDFYEMQRKFELFGQIKYDIEETDDKRYVNFVCNRPGAARERGENMRNGRQIAIEKGNGAGFGKAVFTGISGAGLYLGADAITRAPRKIIRTARYHFSKNVTTKELPYSVVDKTLGYLKKASGNMTKNFVGNRTRTRYTNRKRRPVHSSKLYKTKEKLWYDVFSNKFGEKISLKRACEIATDQKLFGGSKTIENVDLLQELFGSKYTSEEYRIMAKYADKDRSIFRRGLMEFDKIGNGLQRATQNPREYITYKIKSESLENLKMIDKIGDAEIKSFFEGLISKTRLDDKSLGELLKVSNKLDSQTLKIIFGDKLEKATDVFGKNLNPQAVKTLETLDKTKVTNFLNQTSADEIKNRKNLLQSIFKNGLLKNDGDFEKIINSLDTKKLANFSEDQILSLSKNCKSTDEFSESIIKLLDLEISVEKDILKIRNITSVMNDPTTKVIYDKQIQKLEKMKTIKNISVQELDILSRISKTKVYKNNPQIFNKLRDAVLDKSVIAHIDDSEKFIQKISEKLGDEGKELVKILKSKTITKSGIEIFNIAKLASSGDDILGGLLKLVKVF